MSETPVVVVTHAPAGDISDELDTIAKQVPAIPRDYSELRQILAILPEPIASETPSSAKGDPGLFSVGAATPNQSSSSLLGAAPGMTPMSSIGGTTAAPVQTVQTNLIPDAPLDSLRGQATAVPRSSYVSLSADFLGWYEVATGINPQFRYYNMARTDPANLFNSGQLRIGAYPVGACDASASIFGPGFLGSALASSHLAFSFVVGDVRVFRPAGNVYTNVTALTMIVELWRELNAGGARETLLETASLDILAMADNAQSLLKVASAASNWATGEHASVVVKLRVQASAAAGSLVVALAEPLLGMNMTQDAPVFSPGLSHWRPIADDFLAYSFFDGG